MKAIFRRHDTTPGAWTIGKWYECDDDDSMPHWHDLDAAMVWLRGFESDDLRQIALFGDEVLPLSRLTDHDVIRRLAGLLVTGVLRAWRAEAQGWYEASGFGVDTGNALASTIVRRLQVTAKAFLFEGDRLRIVSTQQWKALSAYDGGRYQVVSREHAQTALGKISQWTDISPSERKAVEQAVPLVPDTGRLQMPGGILLLRVIARTGATGPATREPAITPSQLAGRRKTEELHWVQIALVDADDVPVPNEAYKVELPDGSVREGRLDAGGQAYIADIVSGGQCQISFPEIDAKEWRAA